MLARRIPGCLAWWVAGLALAIGMAGCGGGEPPAPARTQASTRPEPITPKPAAPTPAVRGVDWSSRALAGHAWLACDAQASPEGMTPLRSLAHADVRAALAPCQDSGLLRLRYKGDIDEGFVALVERVVDVASATGIARRILDLDSSGGLVEQAIRAGDAIAESDWTIWVRQGAVCHSACVLVLAAGDMRLVAGDVGIHRMMRVGSAAATRSELDRELQAVSDQLASYLKRNGAATAVADLMMSVPNRRLRLLTPEELELFGLAGPNAAEDDLDRIRLARLCGEDFVRRRDAFHREFDRACQRQGKDVEAVNACARDLRDRHGFPDVACPQASPFGELDAHAPP